MTAPRAAPRGRASAAALGLLAFQLGAALALSAPGAAFDPGQIANSGDPAFNLSMASEFRLSHENLTAWACTGCNLTLSDELNITIAGPDRLTGTFAERYLVTVSGVPSFTSNYTTIGVVLKGNTSDVVLQPDASAERTGSQAYTKDLNGSSSMNITLLPSNRTGNITMYVFGYVGEGNRSTHGDREVYKLVKKEIAMRAQRVIPVNVTVANDANVSVRDVRVQFFAKGPNDADFVSIGNSSITALDARGTAATAISWDVTWAEPLTYTLKVVVDPYHEHADALQDNNVLFFQVNLGPPAPQTQQQAVGQAFLIATVAVIAGVAVALWWYNRVYE